MKLKFATQALRRDPEVLAIYLAHQGFSSKGRGSLGSFSSDPFTHSRLGEVFDTGLEASVRGLVHDRLQRASSFELFLSGTLSRTVNPIGLEKLGALGAESGTAIKKHIALFLGNPRKLDLSRFQKARSYFILKDFEVVVQSHPSVVPFIESLVGPLRIVSGRQDVKAHDSSGILKALNFQDRGWKIDAYLECTRLVTTHLLSSWHTAGAVLQQVPPAP